jgi:hypothetical protein
VDVVYSLTGLLEQQPSSQPTEGGLILRSDVDADPATLWKQNFWEAYDALSPKKYAEKQTNKKNDTRRQCISQIATITQHNN